MTRNATPTARTLQMLRDDGWQADIVERRVTKRVTRDLFGVWDVIAVNGRHTLAVQVTTASNVSSRVRKIAESDQVEACRAAGWLLRVHGWRQRAGEWICREVDV